MTAPEDAGRNETGLVLFLDTHIIDAPDQAATLLRRLHEEQWLQLRRADAMSTELSTASPQAKKESLFEATESYPEVYGPMVLGHSRLGATVLGSEEDASRYEATFSILFPNVDRASAKQNHVKDAMHVSTAIRYGAFGLVTREKRLLNKAGAISSAFHGFRLWTPEQALDEARARVAGALGKNQGGPDWLHPTDASATA